MANIASAKKRARQSEKRRQRNIAQRSLVRTKIKNVVKVLAGGNKEAAVAALKDATPTIDRMARKGQISKNKAARHKSRLNARLKALAKKA